MEKRETVYFDVESFSNLLLAVVETYPKECSGLIFGYESLDPEEERFEIWSAIPHQIVYSRTKSSVTEDFKAYRRLIECQRVITGSSHLGGFHSHPDSSPTHSEEDVQYLKEKRHLMEVIIGISKSEDESSGWRITKKKDQIKGDIAIGDSLYSIIVSAFFLDGIHIKPLNVRCGYVEILQNLAKYRLPNFRTIGELYERARHRNKDIYPIVELIEKLEYKLDKRPIVKRKIVNKIKEYIENI